ncbi:MAG: HNH endonuclease [Gammaproteobacteria bacterium]|nr:HNH endonuclease [Gammaproteobacteria bacterium]
MSMDICIEKGCTSKVKVAKLCYKHCVERSKASKAFPGKEYEPCAAHLCANTVYVKGFCTVHYLRQHKTGSCQMEYEKTLKEKFFEKCRKNPDTGHWKWHGALDPHGYGHIRFYQKHHQAHRLAWEYLVGPIPEGKVVCHKDESLGRHEVDPKNLFLGSYWDNERDKLEKGRCQRGEDRPMSVLTEADVRKIFDYRLQGHSVTDIAQQFDVTLSTVSGILKRTSWKHLEGLPEISAGYTQIGYEQAEVIRQYKVDHPKLSGSQIGKIFNIKRCQINNILSGKSWKHPGKGAVSQAVKNEIIDLKLGNNGLTNQALAKKFRISETTVSRIISTIHYN